MNSKYIVPTTILTIILAIGVILMPRIVCNGDLENEYENIFVSEVASYGENLAIYNESKLNSEILNARISQNEIIVERVIAIIVNDNGDAITQNGHYINYLGFPEMKTGDRMLSYLMYNPNTSWEDDIIERYDYKLS